MVAKIAIITMLKRRVLALCAVGLPTPQTAVTIVVALPVHRRQLAIFDLFSALS
jgi:hypothetical protein